MTTYGPHGNNFQFLTTMVATFIGDDFLGVNFLGVIFLGAIFRGGNIHRWVFSQGAIFWGGGGIFTEPSLLLTLHCFFLTLITFFYMCNTIYPYLVLQLSHFLFSFSLSLSYSSLHETHSIINNVSFNFIANCP